MENTKKIWVLYFIMFLLNCLNVEEGATAAKRYLFINAAELIQDKGRMCCGTIVFYPVTCIIFNKLLIIQ